MINSNGYYSNLIRTLTSGKSFTKLKNNHKQPQNQIPWKLAEASEEER